MKTKHFSKVRQRRLNLFTSVQNISIKNCCLRPKAKDIGFTYVVVPGFFVWSMPPCYPLFLFLYFIIIISLLYHYLSIYYHQYLSIYHSMLYHPGAGTGLGRISYLYCSRLIQTVHRFLTQINNNYLKPDGHSFHSKLKSPGFESCIS